MNVILIIMMWIKTKNYFNILSIFMLMYILCLNNFTFLHNIRLVFLFTNNLQMKIKLSI